MKKNEEILSNWIPALTNTLAKSNSLCIAIFNLDGNVVYSNTGFDALVGEVPADSFSNPTFQELLTLESDQEIIFEGFITLGAHKASDTSIKATVYRNSESLFVIGELDAPELDTQNKHLTQLHQRSVNLQRKLTLKTARLEALVQELHDTNIKLSREETTNDKVYTILTHNLKGPLTIVSDYAKLLLKNYAHIDRFTAASYLEKMNFNAKNTLIILGNIIDWNKIQKEAVYLSFTNNNIFDNVEEVIRFFEDHVKQKSITINNSIPNSYIVTADKGVLKSILKNIISNAIKFSNEKGVINISAIAHKKSVVLTVKDQGIGISKNTLAKIFDITHNSVRLGTSQEKGVGLGLIVTKKYIEKNEWLYRVRKYRKCWNNCYP